jgi:hypothetical protein
MLALGACLSPLGETFSALSYRLGLPPATIGGGSAYRLRLYKGERDQPGGAGHGQRAKTIQPRSQKAETAEIAEETRPAGGPSGSRARSGEGGKAPLRQGPRIPCDFPARPMQFPVQPQNSLLAASGIFPKSRGFPRICRGLRRRNGVDFPAGREFRGAIPGVSPPRRRTGSCRWLRRRGRRGGRRGVR